MRSKTCSEEVIVVGAGPAGLMAACRLGEAGRRVLVVEALPRPGLKLLASGAGKCNLTNILAPDDLARRCGAHWRFLLPALRAFPPEALRGWLAARGVATEVTDGFHVFPRSRRAADVLQVLLDGVRQSGGRVRSEAPVTGLLRNDRGITAGVRLSSGEELPAAYVILACGGLGYPTLGAKGLGYAVAREAGHEIVTPVPALVGLRTAEAWPGECRGIVLPEVEVDGGEGAVGVGELLFTHHGISGPAVLDVSGRVAARLEPGAPVVIRLQLQRGRDAAFWREQFGDWQRGQGKKNLTNLLATVLPQAVVQAVARIAAIPDGLKAAVVSGAVRDRVIGALTALPLTIQATEGWPKAMATAGGVALAEVEAKTLRSRLDPALGFAGEFLDIDGPCGGYNLQWAFSSGRLAAERGALPQL